MPTFHQGNQPMLVAKHLTKLFDSMAKIKMENPSRLVFSSYICFLYFLCFLSMTAVAMTAKDGEEVAFFKACLCEGQVSRASNDRNAFTFLQG